MKEARVHQQSTQQPRLTIVGGETCWQGFHGMCEVHMVSLATNWNLDYLN